MCERKSKHFFISVYLRKKQSATIFGYRLLSCRSDTSIDLCFCNTEQIAFFVESVDTSHVSPGCMYAHVTRGSQVSNNKHPGIDADCSER